MQSIVQLFNQALSLAGGENQMVIDPAENTRNANLCRLWYDTSRLMVLAAAPWPSARKHSRLSVISERASDEWTETSPMPGYYYSYALPVDCVRPIFLMGWSPFELGVVGEEKALFTSLQGAILQYTADATNVAIWDIGLYSAVVRVLAAHINTSINGKDGLTEKLLERAKEYTDRAATDFANSEDTYSEAIPDFISQRGYTGPANSTRYFLASAGLSLGGI